MSRGTVMCDSCGGEIHSGICDDCAIQASDLAANESAKANETIATLTREREEAIARLQWRAKNLSTRDSDGDIINWPEVEERWYRNWDTERQRADRAEAQLAEAQRALEIDRHALSAMQRDVNQSQREAERLRAMLRSLQWSITRQEGNTYWAHCPRCLKRMDHGHADDCPLAAALNPPAEGKEPPCSSP